MLKECEPAYLLRRTSHRAHNLLYSLIRFTSLAKLVNAIWQSSSKVVTCKLPSSDRVRQHAILLCRSGHDRVGCGSPQSLLRAGLASITLRESLYCLYCRESLYCTRLPRLTKRQRQLVSRLAVELTCLPSVGICWVLHGCHRNYRSRDTKHTRLPV